jgi:hypothetical protein
MIISQQSLPLARQHIEVSEKGLNPKVNPAWIRCYDYQVYVSLSSYYIYHTNSTLFYISSSGATLSTDIRRAASLA